MNAKGMITRIIGPVVDVSFGAAAPEIYNALTVETNSGALLLEVLQQLGGGDVRCIAMHSTEGLSRGMTAIDTGAIVGKRGVVILQTELHVPWVRGGDATVAHVGRIVPAFDKTT